MQVGMCMYVCQHALLTLKPEMIFGQSQCSLTYTHKTPQYIARYTYSSTYVHMHITTCVQLQLHTLTYIRTYVYSVQLLANKVAMYSEILCTLQLHMHTYILRCCSCNKLFNTRTPLRKYRHTCVDKFMSFGTSLAMYIIMYVCIVAKRRGGGETADPQSSFIWRGEYHHRPC